MSTRGATVYGVLLLFFNTLFLASGGALVVLSALLLSDTERVLLSRLLLLSPEAQRSYYPPFYYAALAMGCTGLAGCTTAFLGYWGACQKRKGLLGTLIGLLAILLLGQAALVIVLCTLPVGAKTLFGIGGILESKTLTEVLQVNFGSPGHELFTAAYDLAQYTFKCCGVLGSSDYEASWWRMQELGSREMRVPLTCCYLDNLSSDARAFLDPVPHNNTVCQAPDAKVNKIERFQQGCLPSLENWFTTQWTYAAGIVAILFGLQLSVFFSAIALCRRLPSRRRQACANSL
ncbi:leukocyte antigen CD37-like isoform X2 [Neocloeon triangulifer]|nr:leukocyte antigen CD37-like isoform X2 [Neocloeon triangulifer]